MPALNKKKNRNGQGAEKPASIIRQVQWPGLKQALACAIGIMAAAFITGGLLSLYGSLLESLIGKIM